MSRPKLFERLDKGLDGPLSLVSAPAGSGKTELVGAWLEASEPRRSAAWVSVERRERDSQRFWRALIDSLRAAAGETTIQPLAPTPSYEGEVVVERLVGELTDLEGRVVLVIDDVHEISSPVILEQLTYFLDHLTDRLHVVLLARRDPQLGLQRRKLEFSVTEIRSDELQFTRGEAEEMFSALGIDLSDEAMALIYERAEGWVAGLRLAALSLSSHPDPERFAREFSGSERTVADYLVAEVLDSQPAEIRRLLTRTALLDQVNGELGDLLTGDVGSERHLQALAAAGGFVVALDANRSWFRFHHLFADLLALELRHTEPEQIPRLHLAAARWHAENGDPAMAIANAQAAGANDEAVGLLIDHYFGLTLDGRRATARVLLEAFAPAAIAADAELAVVAAGEQLADGSLDQAAAHLAVAQEFAEAVREERRHRFEMVLLVTRLTLARHLGDFSSVSDEVKSASASLQSDNRLDTKMRDDVRALMLMNLGIVEVWSGHGEEGMGHLTQARDLAMHIGRAYLQTSCQAHLAQATLSRSFTLAREACKEAIELAESQGWGDDPVIGPALVTLGISLSQTGRLKDAEDVFERAEQTLRSELEPAVGFVLRMARGGLRLAQVRIDEAIVEFREAERLEAVLLSEAPLALQQRCALQFARIALGELSEVHEELSEAQGPERETGEVRDVLAALALARDDFQGAIDAVQPTLDGKARVHHDLVVIRSLLRVAVAHYGLSDMLAAEDAVERALGLSEKDTLLQPFYAHSAARGDSQVA